MALSPIGGLAVAAMVVANLVSWFGVYNSRKHLKELWHNRRTSHYIARLDAASIILCILSSLCVHITIVEQECATFTFPVTLFCSAYQNSRGGFAVVSTINAILNGLLLLGADLLCSARWEQMKASVPYNRKLQIALNCLFGVLTTIKIAAQLGNINEQPLASTVLAASSAALTLTSIIFDVTICVLVGSAVVRSQVKVRKEQEIANLRRELDIFRGSLAALLLVDFIAVGTTMGLQRFPAYRSGGVAISLAACVVHSCISRLLLRSFVEKALSRDHHKTAPSTNAELKGSIHDSAHQKGTDSAMHQSKHEHDVTATPREIAHVAEDVI